MYSIDDIYNKFIERMIINNKNHGLSVNFLENKLQEILKSYHIDDINGVYDKPIYLENLIFYSWEKSRIITYSTEDVTLSMLIKNITNHQNKQYQWHLVSAFEDYENFLRQIYSYLICIKNKPLEMNMVNFYRCFDSIYELIFENMKNKDSTFILQKLRKELLKYKELEIINDGKCNKKFVLALIKYFRNFIVHHYGVVSEKDILLNKNLSNIGLSKDSDVGKQCINYFNIFFPDSTKEITLLEIPVMDIGGFKASTDILDNLFMHLLNSAYYISNEIKEKYGA
jgi:hypothetical protein